MRKIRFLKGITIGGTIHKEGDLVDITSNDLDDWASGKPHTILGRVAEYADKPKKTQLDAPIDEVAEAKAAPPTSPPDDKTKPAQGKKGASNDEV